MTEQILNKKELVFIKTGLRTCRYTSICSSTLVELTDDIRKLFKSRNQTPHIQDGFNGDYYLTGKYNQPNQDFVCPKCERLE